jgi:hypothetical protein
VLGVRIIITVMVRFMVSSGAVVTDKSRATIKVRACAMSRAGVMVGLNLWLWVELGLVLGLGLR